MFFVEFCHMQYGSIACIVFAHTFDIISIAVMSTIKSNPPACVLIFMWKMTFSVCQSTVTVNIEIIVSTTVGRMICMHIDIRRSESYGLKQHHAIMSPVRESFFFNRMSHQNSPGFHSAALKADSFETFTSLFVKHSELTFSTSPSSMTMVHSSPVLTLVAMACKPFSRSHAPNCYSVSRSSCSSLSSSMKPQAGLMAAAMDAPTISCSEPLMQSHALPL